jgi:alkylation response protein AidB-like acyl-CoA dehydrogenase
VTTGAAELHELAVSLRGVLGTADPTANPTLDPGWRSSWPALAGLGITAFCVPEDLGGYGCEAAAALVASRELGAALHGSPFASATAAAYALSRGLDASCRAEVVGRVVAGEEIVTWARLAAGSTITRDGPVGITVEGTARLVAAGDGGADAHLVVTGDGAAAYVPRSDRCTPSGPDTFDVTRTCADVTFTSAPGHPVRLSPALAARAERLRGLLLAGDALGGVQRMLDRTVAYAAQRPAFGRVIGGFQAVQHRLVDHAVRVRGLSLLATAAAEAMAAGAADADRRSLLAEAAVARDAVPVLHDLLQLTGAIGFTWEYGLHAFERRAHLDARMGGNPRQALRDLVDHEGWLADAPAGKAS